MMRKEQAEKRADRIRAFREELETLESEGVLQLSPEQKQGVDSHQNSLLESFNRSFDVDTTQSLKNLSMGMRIVTAFGGLALCASIYFMFVQIWGYLATSAQVSILVAGPIVLLPLAVFAEKKESTLYYASMISLAAIACFIINLALLGRIFNLPPTPNAFLVWGAFSLILAYRFGLRLQLAVGLLCLLFYFSVKMGTWSGAYWLSFGERPEKFIPVGLAIALVPRVCLHTTHIAFPSIYRAVGLIAVFIAVLIMSNWGSASYFSLDRDWIEGFYQFIGFTGSALTIWWGIRCQFKGVTNIGATFFTIFLYTKFFDWWWEAMPKSLFFLLISLISLGLLSVFKRMRSHLKEVTV